MMTKYKLAIFRLLPVRNFVTFQTLSYNPTFFLSKLVDEQLIGQ
jgi:hypothetical protein